MRTGTLAVAVMVAALSAGCASSPDPEGDADSPSGPTGASGGSAPSASPEPRGSNAAGAVDPEGARQAVRKGIRAVRTEPVAAFEATTTIAGTRTQQTNGITSAEGWTSRTEFVNITSNGPPVYVMRTVATTGTLWMQVEGWPEKSAGCWLTVGPTQVPLGVLALLPDEPAYLSLLANLTALDFADEKRSSIRAETPLATASYLFPSKLMEKVELDADAAVRTRIPVLMGYDGTRISGIGIQGSDFVTALDDAGAAPTGLTRTGLESTNVVVNYPESDASGAVSAPPQDKQYSADSEGCN